jgi:hypothetical protein
LQSLPLSNVCAVIRSKLLIALIGFRRHGVAFDPETADECTQSKLHVMRHAWYVGSLCSISNEPSFSQEHPGVSDGPDGFDGTLYPLTENQMRRVALHISLAAAIEPCLLFL